MIAIYTDNVIFSVQSTIEAGIDEFNEFVNAEDAITVDDVTVVSVSRGGERQSDAARNQHSTVVAAPITPALAAEAGQFAGDVSWGQLENGTLCTEDEAEAARLAR